MRRGTPPPESSGLLGPHSLSFSFLHSHSHSHSHSHLHSRPQAHRDSRRHSTMNAFWDIVDWLLPPVRIIDDLADSPPEYAHRSRSGHHHREHHTSQVTRRLSGKDHDRDRRREKGLIIERGDRERTKEREREKERPVTVTPRLPESDREREHLRQRVQQLERENESLLEQLRATREELSTLTAALFPPTPTSPSERTPPSLSLSYPVTPPDPANIALPLSRTHSRTSSSSDATSTSSPRTPLQAQRLASQHSAEAALADPRRLRVLYASLRATYGDARQTIRSQAEELASLKSFLSKTDDWSGAQLLQAVADLNSEIIQLSASVAEEFAAGLRADGAAPSVARERDREIVAPALGREMMKLLEEREHAGDPTLVQFALQAWEVWCVARVMDAFCYGLPGEVDEALRLIFERMQLEEPQPTTSRWRALTYKHAKTLLARSRSSTEPSSPDTITASPFNSAPASIVSPASLPAPLLTLTEANLRGVLAILALSGCTDVRGLHRDPLRAKFGSALARISARAERISSVVKEGVLSGLFDVVWVPSCRSAGAPSSSSKRPSGISALKAKPNTVAVAVDMNGVGANRGKGKEREWVKEVEQATQNDDTHPRSNSNSNSHARAPGDEEEVERWFDWDSMENVYAGHCNEECRVLCTVELGLAFERRMPEDEGREEEESVDGDGMVVSGHTHAHAPGLGSRPSSSNAMNGTGSRPPSAASALRPVAMGGVGMNGVGGSVSVSMSHSLSGDGHSDVSSEGGRVVRNLLLKPKVLLESVVELL